MHSFVDLLLDFLDERHIPHMPLRAKGGQMVKKARKQIGVLVQVDLYNKFKAKAAEKGLTLTEALHQAMKDFIAKHGR